MTQVSLLSTELIFSVPLTKDPRVICPAEEIKPTTIVIIILVAWISTMLIGYGVYEMFGHRFARTQGGSSSWISLDNGDDEVLLSSESGSENESETISTTEDQQL